MTNIFSLTNQWKLTDLTVKYIFFAGESVKKQTTNSISENLTNSDLESTFSSPGLDISFLTTILSKCKKILICVIFISQKLENLNIMKFDCP